LSQHECFEGYDETIDVLNIDENLVATIGKYMYINVYIYIYMYIYIY